MSINFSVRWADNTKEFTRNLKEGLDQIEVNRAAVDKLANSLSGQNVLKSANNWAAALQKIGGEVGALGGVQKLTTAEMDRAIASFDRAIAKSNALGTAGSAVTKSYVEISDALKKVRAETDATATSQAKATQSAGLLGGAFSQMFAALSAQSLLNSAISKITQLTHEAFASADALVSLSNKTGLSTKTIQEMQFVAKQSGSDMQQFADAAFKMGVNVSEGTKKARDGAESLGLDWQKLRAASPDDQFNMVVKALESMEDPQKRNAAAVALFGKTAKDILPAIVDGYTKIAKEAAVAGDAQVRATDAFGDAIDRAKARMTASTIQFIGSMLLRHESLATLTTDEREFVKQQALTEDEFRNWVLGANASTEAIEKFDAAINKAAEDKRKFGNVKGLSEADMGLGPPMVGPTRGDIAFPAVPKLPTSFTDDLKAAEAAYRALTAAQKDSIAAALQLNKGNDEIINKLNITEEVLSVAKKAFEEHKSALAKAAAAAADWAKVITDIESVGDDFRKTILQIDGAVVEWATHLLKSGADAKTVAAYYHLTEGQIKALQQAIKDDTDAEKTLSEIRNKFEAGTLDLNEALKKVNSTELIAIKEHLDLAKAMHLVEQSIPPVVAGFHGLGEDITHVGMKSTELDQVIVHLKGVDKAADEARKRLVGMWEIAGAINDTFQSLDLGNSQLGKTIHQFDGIASAAISAGKAIAQFGANSAQAGASVLDLAVAWYNFWAARGQEQLAEKNAQDNLDLNKKLSAQFHTTTLFSDALSRSIANVNTTINGTTGSFEAAGLHINDIVKELGGWAALTKAQLKDVQNAIDSVSVEQKLPGGTVLKGGIEQGLFAIIKNAGKGSTVAAQATEQLDQALAGIGTTAVATGGLVDKFFLDETAKAKKLGIELKQTADFMVGQATSAETGIVGALTATNDAWAKRKTLQDQVSQATTDLSGKSGSALADQQAKLADLNAQLLTQQRIIDATGIHSQAAAGAVSGALLGVIGSQVAAGTSFGDAIRKVAPGIESLKDQLNAMGVGGGDAFDFLNQQVDLFTGEVTGPALQSIEGYAQGLVGLNNAGQLNQDTFAGITEQIGKTEQALESQGVNGRALLTAMQSPLQKMWELEQKFGYTTDASTQALIDQAKEQGLVGDKFKPVAEQMLDATNRIADAVEGLAEVFGVLPKAAKDAASGISDELGKIKTPTIKIPVTTTEPTFDYHLFGGTPSDVVYAHGGKVKPYYMAVGGGPVGTDTVPAWLTPGEGVVTKTGMTALDALNTGRLDLALQPIQSMIADDFRDFGSKAITAIHQSSGISGPVLPGGSIGVATPTTTITSGSKTIVLQEQFTFNVTNQNLDTQGLDEYVEKKFMPRIMTQIEDRRRGFTGRLRRALELPIT